MQDGSRIAAFAAIETDFSSTSPVADRDELCGPPSEGEIEGLIWVPDSLLPQPVQGRVECGTTMRDSACVHGNQRFSLVGIETPQTVPRTKSPIGEGSIERFEQRGERKAELVFGLLKLLWCGRWRGKTTTLRVVRGSGPTCIGECGAVPVLLLAPPTYGEEECLLVVLLHGYLPFCVLI